MNEQWLISYGLSQKQARTYRALVTLKRAKPLAVMKLTGESRTNTYTLLDKLVEMGLAIKQDEDKKYVYYPTSPLALKNLIDRRRRETERQLIDLEEKMPQLLSAYREGGEAPRVTMHKGKLELEEMYIAQLKQPGKELQFVRSKADVAYFGFEKVDKLRKLSTSFKKRRVGITPRTHSGAANPERDAAAGGLKRTWVKNEEYTAKVEWVVSGSQIQAIYLDGEGYGITIDHVALADSLRQILQLVHTYAKLDPNYQANTPT